MYYEGKGVEQNYSRAVELYKKGCKASDMTACALLGTAYEEGKGVERDANRALDLYKKSCDTGNTKACEFRKMLLLSL